MKTKLLFTFLLLAFTIVLKAQVPQKFSYQAVLRNNNNELVKNTQIKVKVSIGFYMYLGLPPKLTFISIYSETHTPQTNENGLFTISIGGGTVLSGKFDTIPWTKYNFYLGTEIDPAGGNNYTISNITPILSVPYALTSSKSDTAVYSKNGIIAYGNISANGTINKSSGNFTASRHMQGTYYITWSSESKINTRYDKAIVSITPIANSVPAFVNFSSMDGGATLIVNIKDNSGNPLDCNFSFIVINPF